MESQPPIEAVNTLPPENLPPANHVPVPLGPRVFDQRQKLAIVIELVKSGEPTSVIAARHGILPRLLRNWSNAYNARAFEVIKKEQAEKQTGKKLIQVELIKESEVPMEKAKEETPKKVQRRTFSDKEKILYAVRFKKLGVSLDEGAKQLGVSGSSLDRWTREFAKIETHKRAGIVRGANSGQLEEQIKLKTLKRIVAGERPSELARELKVHSSSIKNWWAKYRPKEPWPKQPTTRPEAGAAASPIRARNILDTRAAAAVERIKDGELISDIATELKVGPGTVRHWWRALNGNRKWPKQYGMKQLGTKRAKGGGRKPNGPQRKTLQRMAVRDALISNGEVIAAQEVSAENMTHANGHAQPISTGKAVHDATIFLQLARDEFQKAVKAGKLRVDDPTMLLPMLALHTLSK